MNDAEKSDGCITPARIRHCTNVNRIVSNKEQRDLVKMMIMKTWTNIQSNQLVMDSMHMTTKIKFMRRIIN